MKILEGQKGKQLNESEYLTYTHKRCSECNNVKAVNLFYKRRTRTKRGWAWDTYCIECRRAACRKYGVSNRAKRNERLRRWRTQNPLAAKKHDKKVRLKRKYGITEDEIEAFRNEQNGACAICHRITKRLFIDHCHKSGKIRGLLCPTCNTFLGWYENKASIILEFQKYLNDNK